MKIFHSFIASLLLVVSHICLGDKEIQKQSQDVIVSNLGVTLPPEQVTLEEVNSSNKRLFDWASAANGAYGTSDCLEHSITANLPLEGISVYSMGLSYFQANCVWEIHFIRPVVLDTIVFRSYDNNINSHFFTKFEGSHDDGLTWTEIIPPNTSRSRIFQERFSARLIKVLRIQGFSSVRQDEITQTSVSDKLAVTRLQAFFANQQDL
jgi:hypothetical protein